MLKWLKKFASDTPDGSDIIELSDKPRQGPHRNPVVRAWRTEERAYQLWEEAGRPEGRSDEFWNRAENGE